MQGYRSTDPSKVLCMPDSMAIKVGAAIMRQGLTAWTITPDAYGVRPSE